MSKTKTAKTKSLKVGSRVSGSIGAIAFTGTVKALDADSQRATVETKDTIPGVSNGTFTIEQHALKAL